MFASRTTKTIEVQDDDGRPIQVTLQKLSARSLEKAREAKSIAQLTAMRPASKDMWAGIREGEAQLEDLKKEIREKKTDDPKARAKARYDSYDREHVIRAGVVRWTAARTFDDGAIGDLDEDTADKLHAAILDLSLPPLDPVEAEAALAKS